MAEAPAIHDLRLMTSPEVKAALPTIGCLLVPVGSCEQHGTNLALRSLNQLSRRTRRLPGWKPAGVSLGQVVRDALARMRGE